MDELNKIPEAGDEFVYRGYCIRVEKADDRRVQEILLTKLDEAEGSLT